MDRYLFTGMKKMFMNNREIKNKDIQKIYKTKKNVLIWGLFFAALAVISFVLLSCFLVGESTASVTVLQIFYFTGAILLIVSFFCIWLGGGAIRSYHKAVGCMSDAEFDKLDMELANPETVYLKKSDTFFTPDCLIYTGLRFEMIAYKDIRRVYRNDGRGPKLEIITMDDNHHHFDVLDDLEEIIRVISAKNPNVAIGKLDVYNTKTRRG